MAYANTVSLLTNTWNMFITITHKHRYSRPSFVLQATGTLSLSFRLFDSVPAMAVALNEYVVWGTRLVYRVLMLFGSASRRDVSLQLLQVRLNLSTFPSPFIMVSVIALSSGRHLSSGLLGTAEHILHYIKGYFLQTL